jgi:hypothetical protein
LTFSTPSLFARQAMMVMMVKEASSAPPSVFEQLEMAIMMAIDASSKPAALSALQVKVMMAMMVM